jgi:hypothetical protein
MESAAARSFFPTDRRVVYYSRQDRCWIAHSTLTDQIGTGETIIEAMVDLLRALEQLLELARQDPSIQIYRRAPASVLGLLTEAIPIPAQIVSLAEEKFRASTAREFRIDAERESTYAFTSEILVPTGT